MSYWLQFKTGNMQFIQQHNDWLQVLVQSSPYALDTNATVKFSSQARNLNCRLHWNKFFFSMLFRKPVKNRQDKLCFWITTQPLQIAFLSVHLLRKTALRTLLACNLSLCPLGKGTYLFYKNEFSIVGSWRHRFGENVIHSVVYT